MTIRCKLGSGQGTACVTLTLPLSLRVRAVEVLLPEVDGALVVVPGHVDHGEAGLLSPARGHGTEVDSVGEVHRLGLRLRLQRSEQVARVHVAVEADGQNKRCHSHVTQRRALSPLVSLSVANSLFTEVTLDAVPEHPRS